MIYLMSYRILIDKRFILSKHKGKLNKESIIDLNRE